MREHGAESLYRHGYLQIAAGDGNKRISNVCIILLISWLRVTYFELIYTGYVTNVEPQNRREIIIIIWL